MRRFHSRTIHRYLSVVMGVQLLLWTVSGLIFSWNPIEQVRGEHLLANRPPQDLGQTVLISLPDLQRRHPALFQDRKISEMTFRHLLDEAVIQVTLHDSTTGPGQRVLFEARQGNQLSPITAAQAEQIALADFGQPATARSVERIETATAHSEYRGNELPAWRVVLDHRSETHIYVSVATGQVTKRRNARWRLFDFFWMLHTMDYRGRDNFNHLVLRGFALLGVTTVVSGYWLWWRTSRWQPVRRRPRKRPEPADRAND
jgi:uncharacterized iron-regulated membrane protein